MLSIQNLNRVMQFRAISFRLKSVYIFRYVSRHIGLSTKVQISLYCVFHCVLRASVPLTVPKEVQAECNIYVKFSVKLRLSKGSIRAFDGRVLRNTLGVLRHHCYYEISISSCCLSRLIVAGSTRSLLSAGSYHCHFSNAL